LLLLLFWCFQLLNDKIGLYGGDIGFSKQLSEGQNVCPVLITDMGKFNGFEVGDGSNEGKNDENGE
jgi:hypothetical protein